MNRRVLHIRALLVVLVMGMAVSPLSLSAQEATPGASLLEDLGLPVLEVTVTSDGVEAPAEIEAGPVLLVAHNHSEGLASVDLVQLPDGVTVDDYLAVTQSEDGSVPAWAADLVLAGYAEAEPMASDAVALNLAPGEWAILANGEGIAEPMATLTVTGEIDAAAVDAVPADLEVELGHYAFDFPETVPAGPQVWKVTNSHDGVLHHVVVLQTDRLYTSDEVMEGIMGDFSGTPVADGFSLFNLQPGDAAASPVLSSGQSVWIEANMEPGYYVAICFLPDPGNDVPHVMQGMIDTFEVTAP